jgi:glycosyltransferase involved in cell wall biosynthesis
MIATMRQQSTWDLSVIAWGHPSDVRTFSGSSRGLTAVLKGLGALRREYSAKQLTPLDTLSGALAVRWRRGRPRMEVRRPWMWSEAGRRTLSQRVNAAIRRAGDRGAFLQVGTQVEVDPEFGPHYQFTDMTIPQACRAHMFPIGRASAAQVDRAVAVQRRVLRQAAHVFVLSDWTRQSLLDDFGMDPARVTTVYAGPNLNIPAGLHESRGTREILFVGIDWERKGGPLLAEAFALLRRRLPDATLRIIGCRPAVSTPGVEVEGYLDRRDPAQFERICRCYLRAACFCLPSFFDPFPIAIIEAATAGLPVVAIDNGSRREAVVDGRTGTLAPEPTAPALAEALYQVLRDPERCRCMGQAARLHAYTRFTWELVVDRIGRAVAAGGPVDAHLRDARPVTRGTPETVG